MTKQEKDNKDKLRVYEYAKSLNMSSKEIITILKRINIPVNNHMSVMENDAVAKVEQFFKDVKANAQAKREGGPQSKPQAQAQVSQVSSKTAETPKRTENSSKENNDNKQRQGQREGQRHPQRDGRDQQRDGNRSGSRDGRPSSPAASSDRNANRGGSRDGQREQQRQGDRQTSMNTRQGNNQGKPNGQGDQRRPQQGGQSNNMNRGGQQRTAPQQSQRQQQPARSFDSNNDSASQKPGNKNQSRKPNSGSKRFDDNRTGGNMRGGRGGRGGKNRGRGNNQQQVQREKIDNTPKKIIVRGEMTVGELAKLLHKDASEVIKKLLFLGVMATINQEVDLETIQLIADEFKVEVDLKLPVSEDPFEDTEEKDDEADLQERPAVVTIMGHVDHGKTTLLDAIRKTNVTSAEAGGITQHIGAYQVEFNNKKVTFLDTPGHEAFTLMRSRGAQVTDITIIVVAADDGVMPQTVEAISHAKAANCPIIVAVNKIDKPEANPDRVKQELTEYELVPEEWGGDTIFVNVSAKQRMGLDELLEMILLVAEVNEYKANPDKRARGTVIEAELDKGRGPVARILVQHGTLKVGDAFVAGTCFGRVRAMVNDRGRRLKEAGPSTPVEITGLTDVPQAGDPFMAFEDERKARSIAEKRATTYRQSQLGANTRVTLDDLFKHIKEGEMKELNVIIKGDVQGSVEALRGSLQKIDVEGVRVKILHSGVGAITESDIILATASNAIVLGFNVRPDAQAKATADEEKVDIRLHRVIYTIVEEIEQAMKGMLDPEYKEVVIGHAEVRNTFKISKIGTIAGCMVTQGKISRAAEARLIRDGIVIFEGKIDSLKRFKDDAKEVAQGYECGIMLDKYNDLREGDVIEAFVMETVERK
ncbi:translation initiation factor IF-2 [Paenibacillus apiarius]|uniref:Translation initiation factor IF-2 n=1 Tax=Paenibacillus apiarius TaxID=46240 RepID=A0ABT4DMF1_9BACL|nr:translation initiation factor IF-2 [Paenibacillus apiarius]MCY9516130.1 translation initiation factor IF-2 [Paenibacillus apiarius]MCY9518411.1 translation initiation factor IF-2 [Paenibacillus apiarius]MCY9551188.1 translation initiation factor IF-2 [Paenibacillus apiarius]MCY9558342.1 translation initiation factor IF-2 [Paenibacillus apiarius]MCY9684742.1 translation initiation factor IF-2 [Paenibacillus apiarius]